MGDSNTAIVCMTHGGFPPGQQCNEGCEFAKDGFDLDPYGEFGPNPDNANDRTDAEKLRLLADWFDRKDDEAGIPQPEREVQADLRRIAEGLENGSPEVGS